MLKEICFFDLKSDIIGTYHRIKSKENKKQQRKIN